VGALLLHRHLAAGSVLVLAAGAVTLLTGSSWGGLDLVLPFAVVLFTLGRAAPRWVLGLAAVSIAATVSAFRDGFALEKLVVTTALYGTVWAFGFVVRGRAERAHATAMQVKHLAAQDPRVVGARLAAEE